MESLCHAMSDQKGERDNNIWATLGRDKSDLSYFFSVLMRKDSVRKTAEQMQLDPSETSNRDL